MTKEEAWDYDIDNDEGLKIPKRKMPKKGTKITVKYRDERDPLLVRVKEIIKRYGLEAEFVKDKRIKPSILTEVDT